MNKTRIFLSLAMVCAAVVLSFVWPELHIGPGEASVRWSFPMMMTASDTGEMVIENDAFKSLVILDRDGRLYIFKADDGIDTLPDVVDGRRNVIHSAFIWKIWLSRRDGGADSCLLRI